MMIIVLNYIGLCASAWVCLWLVKEWRVTKRDEERFRLSTMKEDLVSLAIDEKISENSSAFRNLDRMIDASIESVGTFRIADYACYRLAYARDPLVQRNGQCQALCVSL